MCLFVCLFVCIDGGIGDDVFSMSFDGTRLWTGGNAVSLAEVSNDEETTPTLSKHLLRRQEEILTTPITSPTPSDGPGVLFSVSDVIGCCIDLEKEVAWFIMNGKTLSGHIKFHHCNDMITPAVSFSSGVR